jgi:hypothetical protein
MEAGETFVFRATLKIAASAQVGVSDTLTVVVKNAADATLRTSAMVRTTTASDRDKDDDGLDDGFDNCPEIKNPEQADSDHDKRGDACDAEVNKELPDNGCSAMSGAPPTASFWLGLGLAAAGLGVRRRRASIRCK